MKSREVFKKGLCTAAILALFARAASTYPRGLQVWNSPCSLHLPVIGTFQQELQTESLSRADVLWSVVETANSARRRARRTLRVLESEEIRDPEIKRYLNTVPRLPGFPPLNGNYSFQSLAGSLPLDYERLSTAAVFLEQANFDTSVSSYSSLLRMLYSDVTNLLCSLEQASLVLEQTVNYEVTRDVMADSLRNFTNQADRDQRNFLILRDTVTLLGDIARFYSQVSYLAVP